MIDVEKVQTAVEEFCKSPTLKNCYDTVPTEVSKSYAELWFTLNSRQIHLSNKERLEIAQKMKELRSQFNLEDLKFDYEWCINLSNKSDDEKRIKELEDNQNSD